MFSKIPDSSGKINQEDQDKEILRLGIISKFDLINFYEQLSSLTNNENIKKVLSEIISQEKKQIGQFQTLLLEEDEDYKAGLDRGRDEAMDLTHVE